MKIHSSSLAFSPTGYNVANRDEQTQLAESKKEDSTENNALALLPNIGIADEIDSLSKLQLISDNIEQQQKTYSNPRTAQAVNAYIQENSQALKSQRSELISGIDIFA